MNLSQSKIIAESLKVSGRFVIQLQDQQGVLIPSNQGVVQNLYGGIMDKLQKQDIDQEVKQNSIYSMAQLLTISHMIFPPGDINGIIMIFGDRLNNELTREASLKGLTLMAKN
jgi:hypothetical protein